MFVFDHYKFFSSNNFLNNPFFIKLVTGNRAYGRIVFDKDHIKTDLERLNVKTCNLCHKEDGMFARGELVRQQSGTIQSMVDKGHMLSVGFGLTVSEKKQSRDFLKGF